jgi:ABC-2 type transport system ATP-binding protein|nr:ABC transporter ATP-binding protein [uncultured Oscillibacter sp.]
MIQVTDAVKRFDGFTALDGASITVPDGAIYGLVGPNGAGKSTLIRHLTGILRADSGEILVDGEPIYENPAKKALLAVIPDDWYYFSSASLRDMMRFYRGFYPTFDVERYEKFRDIFEIPEKAMLRRLSKGMQKQAAFWLAMSCRPKYLILDEPVDGLDPVMRRQVWSLMMGDVAENGTTVLVSSHNLRELEDVCDHVGIMNRGKVLLERSLSDLQENIVKLQVVWNTPEPPALPPEMNVLHVSNVGRVYTYIVRGNAAAVSTALSVLQPMMLEALPLSLEEIFIYELGGEHYVVKDLVL